ncbi:F-box/WD repeat-containing protein 10 [Diretmus argenteus]
MKPVERRPGEDLVLSRELTCEKKELYPGTCGSCQGCVYAAQLSASTRWLRQTGDVSERMRYLAGLLSRCTGTRVLESIQRALRGLNSWKVFTYARSQKPGSPQGADRDPRRPDRATDGHVVGVDVVGTWDWFSKSPDWVKSRFMFSVVKLCDPEVLRMLGNLADVLVAQHRRGSLQCNDSEDPALMVEPGSSASMSGVSQYKDLICCLPVHLSKKILGLLDKDTLRCCRDVSLHWRYLADSTMKDIDAKIRQIIKFQNFMRKQRNRIRVSSITYAKVVEVLVPVRDDERGDEVLVPVEDDEGGDEVPVPVEDDEGEDDDSTVVKDKPFEAAYANVRTTTVRMEERNVYCGIYTLTELLEKEDPHRVVGYAWGQLMAMGSKDRIVRLFHVGSKEEVTPVMKGHIGSIRALLLCEDRDLVISAGRDSTIRCWNLGTGACVMQMNGHTGTINCLDVHVGDDGDTLVSGAKDCTVKVWNLRTGKCFEDVHFKHPDAVRCVKISGTTVYSSCDKGLVKMWDIEKASLLRVIDAHQSSVKGLFFDQWHLLSADSDGQVMAWSTSCDAKERLMTFSHPTEVRSLTLTYLRVVTGCMDGKIRIFNLLTGDCLRVLRPAARLSPILSLHFHGNSVLVNTESSVLLYEFDEVRWDNAVSEAGQRSVAEKNTDTDRRGDT